jgi:hypothetical protein
MAVRLQISGRNSDFLHVSVDLRPSYTEGTLLQFFLLGKAARAWRLAQCSVMEKLTWKFKSGPVIFKK